MTAETDYPQAILTWLDTNDSPQLCHRSVQLWHAIHEELSPIVGAAGFIALYGRCVDLCAAGHPWLKRAPAGSGAALCFDTLGAQLAQRDAAGALVVSGALFARFHELLLLLIGASLTDGVLDAAWRDRPGMRAGAPVSAGAAP